MIEKATVVEGNDAAALGLGTSNNTGSTDPATLIKAITSSSDPMSLLLSQLQAQGSSNPTAALLASLLQMRKPASLPAEDPDVAERGAEAQQERERSFQELNETVSRLWAELDVLRKRNDELAAAIGACFLCFGSDPLCPECAGRGRPGSKFPEANAYRKYVLPALSRTQGDRAMRGSVGVSPTGSNGIGTIATSQASVYGMSEGSSPLNTNNRDRK
jgi:hypothetical protein